MTVVVCAASQAVDSGLVPLVWARDGIGLPLSSDVSGTMVVWQPQAAVPDTTFAVTPLAWYDVHSRGSASQVQDRSSDVPLSPLSFSSSSAPQFISASTHPFFRVADAVGSYVRVSRSSALTSYNTLEFRVRVSLPSLPSTWAYLAGTEATHTTFLFESSSKLRIAARETPGNLQIGSTLSSAIPFTANKWMWLRGKLTISTANCEYWWSLDDTDDHTAVSWTSLTGGVGSNAGLTPYVTNTNWFTVGAYSSGLTGRSEARFRAGWQEFDGSNSIGFLASDLTQSGGTNSLGSSGNTGKTITVARPTSGRKTVVISSATNATRSVVLA